MNRVILIGNLARDPELRTTQSGISTCSFTIAVNRPRSKDGTQATDFIPIVTWRNTAESCAKYLFKGKKVAVDGRMQVRTYEAKDGTKRYVTEVIAETVEFLSPAASGQTGTGGQPPASAGEDNGGFTQVDDDDLPF